MKTIELTAELRASTGKRVAKDLRSEEKVPGVIYHNSQAKHIQIGTKALRQAVYTPETYIVNLDVEGEKVDTIVRSVDYHPVTEKMLHVEFMQITDDKPVILTLPLELTGTPEGVAKGGKLTVQMRKVKVKGIPSQLPDRINVDVSPLDLGETIKLSSAELEGITLISPPSAAVATVIIPRALRSAQAAAEDKE
ncbi:MAG: 50S ribosomal protein L25 [Bacteroidota bacterium]